MKNDQFGRALLGFDQPSNRQNNSPPQWAILKLAALILARAWAKGGAAVGRAESEWPPEFRTPSGVDFVLIPAGTFRMGASPGDREALDDEKPAREVTISRPFYLGKYEVTQAQWQAVMGSNPSHYQRDETLPVESVSYDQVVTFIKRLNENERAGDAYRLPTEAEWEYAARAG